MIEGRACNRWFEFVPLGTGNVHGTGRSLPQWHQPRTSISLGDQFRPDSLGLDVRDTRGPPSVRNETSIRGAAGPRQQYQGGTATQEAPCRSDAPQAGTTPSKASSRAGRSGRENRSAMPPSLHGRLVSEPPVDVVPPCPSCPLMPPAPVAPPVPPSGVDMDESSSQQRHAQPAQSVGTTGAMVPSALKLILSMQISRWFPSPPGIAQR